MRILRKNRMCKQLRWAVPAKGLPMLRLFGEGLGLHLVPECRSSAESGVTGLRESEDDRIAKDRQAMYRLRESLYTRFQSAKILP